jgi:DNA sulfur modification protein DndC
MQGFIQSGEAQLQPLADFRDWLKQIREDPERRNRLRRDERSAGPGPFDPATRMEILERLLAMESKVGFELISDGSLAYIRKVWRDDFDYKDDARRIAATFGREGAMQEYPIDGRPQEDRLLEQCALDADFPTELAQQLLQKVKGKYAHLDRWGAKTELQDDIRKLIEQDIQQAKTADPNHDI